MRSIVAKLRWTNPCGSEMDQSDDGLGPKQTQYNYAINIGSIVLKQCGSIVRCGVLYVEATLHFT